MPNAAASPKAYVFDAYGTLFDYASAAARSSASLGGRADHLTRLWREKQLQYTWLRSLQDQYVDFWKVTCDALDFALASLELHDPALRQRLLDSYLSLDAFPDALAALQRIRELGIKTAILSNGSPTMLHAAVSNARMEPLLDAVLSVEAAGVYKPHPKVYQLAVDHFGIDCKQIVFVSANGWDAWAASAFGMRVVWCNRTGAQPERLPGHPEQEIRSLIELPLRDA